jgi:hypothetical protein
MPLFNDAIRPDNAFSTFRHRSRLQRLLAAKPREPFQDLALKPQPYVSHSYRQGANG